MYKIEVEKLSDLADRAERTSRDIMRIGDVMDRISRYRTDSRFPAIECCRDIDDGDPVVDEEWHVTRLHQ
jgi:hypothetical protein